MSPAVGTDDNLPESPWLDDDLTSVDGQPASSATNLASMGFIRAALRRSAWLWCGAAVAGLLVGSGLYLQTGHTHQAATTLLLTVGPEPQPGTAILEDQAIAQSRGVAGLAAQKLGLHQSVDSLLRSYTVTVLTDQILQITANAPSSREAVRRANALATEFLAFRAGQLRAEQRLESAALDQQVSQDKQHVASITTQISQLSAQPQSAATLATVKALRAQADRASSDLIALEQATSTSKASTQVTTAAMIGGSKVLDAASPVPPTSRAKRLLLYLGGGLLIGLILATGIVVVGALLSERLRRRDDVAAALGAPVRSVQAVQVSRWLPGLSRRDSSTCQQRVVQYLRDALPAAARGTVALAVVPVGEPSVAAVSVVALAESCAQHGCRVVVADLAAGAPAAALLGATGPGVRAAGVDGAHIVAAVPDPADFAPVGPFGPRSPRAQTAIASEVAAACISADILLTLIPLDPSVGGEHLRTWAADAVVLVTAGRSSWTRIHAAGEMIRLAGTRLVFGVLVGADHTDESLGVTPAREGGHRAASVWATQADMEHSLAGDPPGGRPADSAISASPLDPRAPAGPPLHPGE